MGWGRVERGGLCIKTCVKRGRDLKYKSKTESKLYNYITIYIFYHIEKILLQMQSNIFLIKYF